MGVNENCSEEKAREDLLYVLGCIPIDASDIDREQARETMMKVGEYYDINANFKNACIAYRTAYMLSNDPDIWKYWASAIKNWKSSLNPQKDKGKIDKLDAQLKEAYRLLAEQGHCMMSDFNMEMHIQ